MRLETLIRDSGKGDTELKAELAKLKAENRSLKVNHMSTMTDDQSEYNEILSKSRSKGLRDRENRDTPSPARTAVTNSAAAATSTIANASPAQTTQGSPSMDKRWLLRFQELENRLKAEKEGRALDQKGAKIRLDEVRKENAELRSEIKGATSGGSSSGSIRIKDQMKDGNGV
jgi:hypothetical protein